MPDISTPPPVNDRTASSPVHRRTASPPVNERTAPFPVKDGAATLPVQDRTPSRPVNDRRATSPVRDRTASPPIRDRTVSLLAEEKQVDLPRMQAGANPQHLLLTLLGDYWYGRAVPLPSAALVRLLEEFGVTGVSARAALSRLARRNLLALSKEGRRTYYALSPRAADVLTEGARHILSFGATDPTWWGRWTVAVFSIPEDQRELRHTLRTRLRWLGLASLYDGVWISPHDRVKEVGVVLRELEVPTATVFVGEIGTDSPPGGDPLRAWDLDELHRLYQQLISDHAALRIRCRTGQVGAAEALVARTALMDTWRNFPNLDPELPQELLPADWPRAQAREVFIDLYDGLAALAEARVRQIVAEYEPELAPLVRTHGTAFSR